MRDLAEEELQALSGGSDFSWGSFLRGAACGGAMLVGAGTGVGIIAAVTACSVLLYDDAY
jgi:hypothetical protein